MPELGTYGSVRGAAGNSRPYRECRPLMDSAASAGGRRTKTSKGGNRDGGTCEDAPHYGDLSAAE
jgi:hypothetical protein